jgi:hypothetical protein
MRYFLQPLMLAAMMLVGSSAAGAFAASELERVDRTLVKEPSYDDSPRYLLLALGQESPTMVWVVEDGRKLYVDKNGNRDLTDDGPPIEPAEVREFNSGPDGASKSWDFDYHLDEFNPSNGPAQSEFQLRRWNYENAGQDSYGLSLTLDRKTPMYAGWFGSFWGSSPSEASIIHFGAPLTPKMLRYKNLQLRSGLRRLSIGFMAPGLGEASESRLNIDAVAADVVPVLEIEWPKSGGGPPLRTSHQLDQRCCYWEFYTTEFEVPAEATVGTAKVSLQLPAGTMPLPLTTTEWEVPVVAGGEEAAKD